MWRVVSNHFRLKNRWYMETNLAEHTAGITYFSVSFETFEVRLHGRERGNEFTRIIFAKLAITGFRLLLQFIRTTILPSAALESYDMIDFRPSQFDFVKILKLSECQSGLSVHGLGQFTPKFTKG